jgi:hypothetical protein
MLLGLINNKLGGMWTELAVAYNEVGNILAIVVARNKLCIKLIRRKLKWPRCDSQVALCILQGEVSSFTAANELQVFNIGNKTE